MKKTIALILIWTLLFALAACAAPVATPQPSATETQPTPEPIVEPTAEPTPEPTPRGFTTSLSQEDIALAEAMPAVAYNALPHWRGHTIVPPSWISISKENEYDTALIELCAERGFNFVRCPLHFETYFLQNNSGYEPQLRAFEQLDAMISSCARNGIHVCLDLHFCPGYSTDTSDENDILFVDEPSQEAFVLFWSTFAEYYKDVPANLLSFNLLNEPHSLRDTELTEETYVELMKKAIDAIRAQREDRLIIVSGIGTSWTEPIYSLVDEKVAQGCSNYFLTEGTQQWPVYCVNKNHESGRGSMVLRGDFPAGTTITFSPMQYCHADFEILADDEPVCSFAVNGDKFDASGLTPKQGDMELDHYGEPGSGYGWHIVTCTTTQPCTAIRIREAVGYFEMRSLRIETPTQSYQIVGDDKVVASMEVPELTLAQDGTITAKDESTFYALDDAGLDTLLKRYADFTQETGVGFVLLEAGFDASIREEAALGAAKALISATEKYSMGWCFWPDVYGVILDAGDRDARIKFLKEDLPLREGAVYVPVTERYAIDEALYKILMPQE